MVKISSKSRVFDFQVQKTPIRGLTKIERSWNYGNLPYFVANTHGLNFIKIGGIWIFWGEGGGQKPPIKGLHVTCNGHLRTWPSYSSQKSCVKIWFGLVEPFKCDHLNFPGERNPLLGGLHVTCNAHFRTWTSYSSQKSCVKIWFGLIEPFKSYRVHKHFSRGGGGAQIPYYGGDIWPVMPIFELWWAFPVKSHVLKFGLDWLKSEVCYCYMWPAMPIFDPIRAFLDKSHVWKFGLDWLRLSRVIMVTQKKKKKKNMDAAQYNILTEFSFRADKKITIADATENNIFTENSFHADKNNKNK